MAFINHVYVVWQYGKDAPEIIAICKTESSARKEQERSIYPTAIEFWELIG
jgi:hypothetical protein